MTVKVRFAPSPTGKLHVGNIRAALFNYLFALKSGGHFLLRSDDTDQARSKPEFEDAIQADLGWLGIKHHAFVRQSARFDAYEEVAAQLRAEGLLYACYETAEELDVRRRVQRARGLPPVYDRAALELTDADRAAMAAAGRRPHWRFKLSQQAVGWTDLIRGETTLDTGSMSDPVLIREDGAYLYTLPSCIDDIDFAITHVIRGEDHVTNTGAQIEIMEAVARLRGGAPIPTFGHHSLLVGKDGEALSKRLGSLSIEGMRADGIEPEAITSLLARLGTSDPVEPIADLASLASGFSFDRMGRAPARFDFDELVQLNGKILHAMPVAQLGSRLSDAEISAPLWEAVRANVTRLADAKMWRDIIEQPLAPVIAPEDVDVTAAAAAAMPDRDLTLADWTTLVEAAKQATGRKGKALFMPLRLALTGQAHGPEMGPVLALIGATRARARLNGKTA